MRKRNPDAKKNWNIANSDRIKKLGKDWRHANPDKVKALNLRRYGLTVEQFNDMLTRQDNKCFICCKPESSKTKSGKIRSLCIDHNHKTGKIRGLLCSNCNNGVGHLKIDEGPDLLLKALEYYLITSTKRKKA
jgi:hypothetical protein